MKKINLFLLLICSSNINIYCQENYWNESFRVVSSYSFTDGTISLKKKINRMNYRTNPDGAKYYKTTFAVDLESDNNKMISIIETEAYTTNNYDKSMLPCMLIDPDKNIVSIFSNSKASDPYYGMDGFIYRIDMYSQKWTKEVVFTKANYGWFSFFGGSDNGNPELYHFSFAGYYAMLSKRNVSGNWSSQRMGSIRPEMADNQYFSHKNILITGYRNVDRMDLQNKNYTSSSSGSSNNYSSGSSKSSSRSSSISTGEIIVGAAVIGVAIFGLSKLFGGSDDNKSSSSSSSSLSSSSKTSSSPSHSNANASRFDEPGYVISINGATSLPDETETNEGKCLCCQKTVDRVISKWIDSKGKKFWRYTCPKCKRIINNYEGK